MFKIRLEQNVKDDGGGISDGNGDKHVFFFFKIKL